MSDHNIWRVYHRDWVIVYSLNAVLNRDDPLMANLEQLLSDGVSEYFEHHYAGRVRDDDVRFRAETLGLTAHAELLLRLPTLKGEFKTEDLAWQYVRDTWAQDSAVGTDVRVVQRDSDQDRDLQSYGVTKLPA